MRIDFDYRRCCQSTHRLKMIRCESVYERQSKMMNAIHL